MRFSKEELKIIKDNYQNYTDREISEMIKFKLGIDRKCTAIKHKRSRMGLSKSRKYTQEINEFIKKHGANISDKQLANMVEEKFDISTTAQGIRRKRHRLNVYKDYDTKFKKGQVSPIRADLYEIRPNKRKGYVIKTEQPNTWKALHRHIYEKKYKVKLDANDNIIFLDGDRENYHIDNLARISTSELTTMDNLELRTKYPEITETGIYLAKLHLKILEREEES